MRAPAVALTPVVLAVLGCGDPTEIVLLGYTDLPESSLRAVEIVITSADAGAPSQRRCACLAASCDDADPAAVVRAAWPLTLGLRPGRTTDPAVNVELRGFAEASCAGTAVVSQRARVRWKPGRRVGLRMSLVASCISVDCSSLELTCVNGDCASVDLPTDDGIPMVPDLAGDAGAGDLAAPGAWAPASCGDVRDYPTPFTPIGTSRLLAVPTPSHLILLWLDAQGDIRGARISAAGLDVQTIVKRGPLDAVWAAGNGEAVMAVVLDRGAPFGLVVPADLTTPTVIAQLDSTVALAGRRVITRDRGTPGFLIAGIGPLGGGRLQRVALDGTVSAVGSLDALGGLSSLSIAAHRVGYALGTEAPDVAPNNGTACGLARLPDTLVAVGPPASVKSTGQADCAETIVQPAAPDGSAAIAILDIDPGNTVVEAREIDGSASLATPSAEGPKAPLAVALSDGVVAAYPAADGPRSATSTRAGSIAHAGTLLPIDLVAFDDRAILVGSTATGLRLTRLCP